MRITNIRSATRERSVRHAGTGSPPGELEFACALYARGVDAGDSPAAMSTSTAWNAIAAASAATSCRPPRDKPR